MSADESDARAFEVVARHPRFAHLVALTRTVAVKAAEARALRFEPLAPPEGDASDARLEESACETELGNAWVALERGPRTPDEQALVRALWAHVLAEPPVPAADEDELAARVVWLAAFTPFDATRLLDRAMGESADAFWTAVAERLRRIDAGEAPGAGRAEALAAAVALRSSTSATAVKEAARLAPRLRDATIAAVLARGDGAASTSSAQASELHGELTAAPRAPWKTVVLALTGLLFASASVRLLARVALAYRRPADVTLTATSVRVRWQTRILGRTLKDHDVLLARQGLARAAREVRYPRAAFYAGLVSLGLGSLVGVRTFVDGIRAASPSLLFYGALIVALGAALDFALAALGSRGAQGTCRVVFVSRDGLALSVKDVDTALADRVLGQLTQSAK